MRYNEFFGEQTDLDSLLSIGQKTGNQMASSRVLRYQLYVPKKTSVSENIKPDAALWTSTADYRGINPKTGNKQYTSAWAEWCSYEMPEWLSPKGTLYKILPGTKVLNLGSDQTARRVAEILGHQFSGSKYTILQDYPWDKLAQYFDGIRYPARGARRSGYSYRSNNILMSMWDVESTAWFNTSRLEKIDTVDVTVRGW